MRGTTPQTAWMADSTLEASVRRSKRAIRTFRSASRWACACATSSFTRTASLYSASSSRHWRSTLAPLLVTRRRWVPSSAPVHSATTYRMGAQPMPYPADARSSLPRRATSSQYARPTQRQRSWSCPRYACATSRPRLHQRPAHAALAPIMTSTRATTGYKTRRASRAASLDASRRGCRSTAAT